MRKMIIPVFIPHKGCPHNCVFCNQKKISGSLRVPSGDEIRDIISRYINNAEKDADIEIAFYGGSFTGISLAEQERLLSAAYEFRAEVGTVRVSTRPDCINNEILDLLKAYNVKIIELGVQSLDTEVFKKKREGT